MKGRSSARDAAVEDARDIAIANERLKEGSFITGETLEQRLLEELEKPEPHRIDELEFMRVQARWTETRRMDVIRDFLRVEKLYGALVKYARKQK